MYELDYIPFWVEVKRRLVRSDGTVTSLGSLLGETEEQFWDYDLKLDFLPPPFEDLSNLPYKAKPSEINALIDAISQEIRSQPKFPEDLYDTLEEEILPELEDLVEHYLEYLIDEDFISLAARSLILPNDDEFLWETFSILIEGVFSFLSVLEEISLDAPYYIVQGSKNPSFLFAIGIPRDDYRSVSELVNQLVRRHQGYLIL